MKNYFFDVLLSYVKLTCFLASSRTRSSSEFLDEIGTERFVFRGFIFGEEASAAPLN